MAPSNPQALMPQRTLTASRKGQAASSYYGLNINVHSGVPSLQKTKNMATSARNTMRSSVVPVTRGATPAYGAGKCYNSRQSLPFDTALSPLAPLDEARLSSLPASKVREKYCSVFSESKVKQHGAVQVPGLDQFMEQAKQAASFDTNSDTGTLCANCEERESTLFYHSLRWKRFAQNVKDNRVFAAYVAKATVLNVAIGALVVYSNWYSLTYLLFWGALNTAHLARVLAFVTTTFVYQHCFVVFVTVVAVLTNNNYVVLSSMLFNTILCSLELAFYGRRLAANAAVYAKIVVSNSDSNVSVERARRLLEVGYYRPAKVYAAVVALVAVSFLSEFVIYFFWLSKHNMVKLQMQNSNITSDSPTPLNQGSASWDVMKLVQKVHVKKASVLLSSVVGPVVLLLPVANFHPEPFFAMSTVALLFVFVQLGLVFVPYSVKTTPWVSTGEIFATVFNFLAAIQNMAKATDAANDGDNFEYAAAVFVLYLASSTYNYWALVGASYQEDDSDRFYDQVDVKFLMLQVRKYRLRLLGTVLAGTLLFNAVYFGLYLGGSTFSYQWFVVATVNLAYVPVLVVSLDVECGNFGGYVAIVALFFAQFATVIANYTSTFHNLQLYTLMISTQAGELFAVLTFSVLFTAVTYFFVKLRKHHASYSRYVAAYPSEVQLASETYNHSDNASTIHPEQPRLLVLLLRHFPLRKTVRVLAPLIHVASYVAIVPACLSLNYIVTDVAYEAANGPLELLLLVLVVSFVTVGLAREALLLRSRSAAALVAAVSVTAMTVFAVTVQAFFMGKKVAVLSSYPYGSENVEIRFQIGFLAASVACLLGELGLEVVVLAHHVGSFLK